MQTIELPTLGRDQRRLVDSFASTEAADALHRAAARALGDPGVAARVIVAADSLLAGYSDAVLDRLIGAVTSPEFASLLPTWIRELREIASARPDSGACTAATALKLWSWTFDRLRRSEALDDVVAALPPLIAARSLALEVGKEGGLRRDLCHVYAAHVSALAGAACAELVFGYRHHPAWDAAGCATCYGAEELDELEGYMPGIAAGARTSIDIIEADGSHPAKEGPCTKFDGVEELMRLRRRLDGCLTGARLAKERAAAAIAEGRA